MGLHVECTRDSECEFDRPEMIEEDEGSRHMTGMKWQHPANFETTAKIVRAPVYDPFNRHRFPLSCCPFRPARTVLEPAGDFSP